MHDLALDRKSLPTLAQPPGAGLSAAFWGRRLVIVAALIGLSGAVLGATPAVALLTAMGFACAALGLLQPSLGFLAIAMLCTLDVPSRYLVMRSSFLRWSTFNYWLVMVALIHLPLLLRLKGLPVRMLQLLGLVLLLGILYSPAKLDGVEHVLWIVGTFGILAACMRGSRDPRVWYWSAVVNGVMAACTFPAIYLDRGGLPKNLDANTIAYFPVTAIFSICLARAIHCATEREYAWLNGLAFVNCGWIFLTGSRGGLLIGGLGMLYLIGSVRSVSTRVGIGGGAALLAVVLAAIFPENTAYTLERVALLFDADASAETRTSGRSELATAGWHMFLEHPLGVGTGGFAEAWLELRNREGMTFWGSGKEKPAHSAWIKTLAENGVPGVAVLLAFTASFTFAGMRRGRSGLALGLLVSAMVAASFLAHEFKTMGVWLLCSAAIVIELRSQKK